MTATPPTPAECGVVELRRYLLHPGGRDVLIDLFEREFIESQEAEGACLLGLFREEDADDRFVWFRGYRTMRERLAMLQAFYTGPVWRRHSAAANATMISVDDVLLLRPTWLADHQPAVSGGPRPPVEITISDVRDLPDADRSGVGSPADSPPEFRPLARFETLHAENDFPGLPVRDADVVVVVGTGAPAPGLGDVVRCRLHPTSRSRWP
jgi:hypothetical protein